MPRWIWIVLVVVLVGWWLSPPMHRARVRDAGVLAAGEPSQHDLSHAASFQDKEFTITPLADFTLTARVLSRADYRFDPTSSISPTDLAMGWDRMSDSAVIAKLDIDQSGRWYHYHWNSDGPPIPQAEIVRSSANMHMLPANDIVRWQLDKVRAGDVVHLDGQLIEARGPNGGIWRSSLTRNDQGDGACEVVYVRNIVVM